jgi:phosphoribosylformimino-5-aminoimidazole carboxamide ribotide isomerase
VAFCAIPAIDITKGSCVRLKQGLMNESTLYSENPVQVARRWVNEKATRIHLVDLDGAFSGNQENTSLIEQLLQEFGEKISFQVGGGIRDIETVERLINIGATYVVIGTAAVSDPFFLERVCSKFSKKIIVALDGRDGKIATHGWSETTKLDVVDFAKSLQKLNIKNILYTDIGRDGMQVGINISSTLKLAEAVDIPIIASGGLSSANEIEKLSAFYDKGISGVILGKALYEGNICLKKVVETLNRKFDTEC